MDPSRHHELLHLLAAVTEALTGINRACELRRRQIYARWFAS